MTLDEWYAAQLAVKQAELATLNTAITGLLGGGVQQYTLNTGQTTQTVTRMSIGVLYAVRNRLEGEIEGLLVKTNSMPSTVIAKPGF